jgi:adenine-specific DNA-methyltransferase
LRGSWAPQSVSCSLMNGGALHIADRERLNINGSLSDTRSRLGQFMTPGPIAELMASLIRTQRRDIRILDPGAGVGSLTAASVDKLVSRRKPPRSISVTCLEVDERLCARLERTLRACRERCEAARVEFEYDLRHEDFILAECDAGTGLLSASDERYDLVVMNPPYRKINVDSTERSYLRQLHIETSNLYSAFMLLGARRLADGGEFISISPRSFCNGPYFRPFRLELLDLLDIRQLHSFESRNEAFKGDSVLQENLIVYGRRSRDQSERVQISTTLFDGSTRDRLVTAEGVWRSDDPDAVIHLCADDEVDAVARQLNALPNLLADLGITASTGRVVDFRARGHLRQEPGPGTAPLVFPLHVREGGVCWPIESARKPNAIDMNDETERLFVPRGHYVLIRRFSAKEERRRVVAALYDPGQINADRIGFDNKLNYLHKDGRGLDPQLARGLVVYLNSTMLDDYFRTFSGHTQVNATDLRRLPFPTEDALRALGNAPSLFEQSSVDEAAMALFQTDS